MEQARRILVSANDNFKKIYALSRVQKTRLPHVSAFAIFLMDMETDVMMHVRQAAQGAGGVVLSVVFDGLYVTSASSMPVQEIMKQAALWVSQSLGVKVACKMMDGSPM